MALIDTRSTMTRAEFDAYLARDAKQLEVVLDYTVTETGSELCWPPYSIVVTCAPEREDGITRSVAKLLESRGWTADLHRRVRRRRNG